MVGPRFESESQHFELPPGVDLETYCKDQFKRIRLGHHPLKAKFGFDPETGLYDDEKTDINTLISRCSEYMGDSELALVKKSVALMLLAHVTETRDSGEPYSTHCLAVATLDSEYQQDGITTAAGLLHDGPENSKKNPYFHVTNQIILDYIDPEVARTVDGLTKHRSQKLRKSVVNEQARNQAALSIIDNPRVIINKLFDRLHNLRTLGSKDNPESRYNTIWETQQIYIPLAKLLGLFEIAEEMDYLCIRHDDREDQVRLAKLADQYDELSNQFTEQDVIDQITSILGHGLEIHARLTSIAAAYRDPENKFHTNVDIVFNKNIADVADWGISMITTTQNFIWGKHGLHIQGKMPTDIEFYENITSGATDSLGYWVKPGYLDLPYHIHMFPRDVYEREMLPITDMFITSKISNTEIENRCSLAQEKHHILAAKLNQIANPDVEGDTLSVESVVSRMRPRIAEHYMMITEEVGENDASFYQVKEGSSVLDYLRFKKKFNWALADHVLINDNYAPFGTLLQEGDRITIVNGDQESWDPALIFDFAKDGGGPEEVRQKIVELLKKSDKETRNRLYARILVVGAERIEQLLPPDERPFRYGLQAKELHDFLATAAEEVKLFIDDNKLRDVFSAMNIAGFRENDELYFRVGVGLGIFDQSILDRIMNKAREINNQVMVMEVQFSDDLTGQVAILTTLAAQRDISLLSDPGTIPYGGPVVLCRLYIKPEDTDKLQQLLEDIQASSELKNKSFAFARYHPANEKNVYFS